MSKQTKNNDQKLPSLSMVKNKSNKLEKQNSTFDMDLLPPRKMQKNKTYQPQRKQTKTRKPTRPATKMPNQTNKPQGRLKQQDQNQKPNTQLVKQKVESSIKQKRKAGEYTFHGNREKLLNSKNFQLRKTGQKMQKLRANQRNIRLAPLARPEVKEKEESVSDSDENLDTYRTDVIMEKLHKPHKRDPRKRAQDQIAKLSYHGENTPKTFYKHYKRLRQYKQQISCYNLREHQSSYTSIMQTSEQMSLLPKKLGVFTFNGEGNEVNISRYRLGDKYSQILANGIFGQTHIQKLKLMHNNLTKIGAQKLMESLPKTISELDVSYNRIGRAGSLSLAQFFQTNKQTQQFNPFLFTYPLIE